MGAALGFAALVVATRGQWALMFLCLGAALVVDGVDGTLARRLKVAELELTVVAVPSAVSSTPGTLAR